MTMQPNPTTDRLQTANRMAQNNERAKMDAAGVTRAEMMAHVEEIDRMDGVLTAWKDGATVQVRVDDVGVAYDRLLKAGHDFEVNPDENPVITVSIA